VNYRLETLPISKLKTAEYNPRKALQKGDEEFEKLKNSIETLGIIDPIVWNERTGRVVGGHQRVTVCASMGINEIPCFVVDLDEAKEKQANLALNKIGGRFDQSKLEAVLQELDPAVAKLAGFDDKDLKRLEPVQVTYVAREYDGGEFGDDSFEHVCPNCGFRF